MNQTDDRKTCTLCNRKFNSDRLEKHISICKKQKEKKRNVFDSSKQRQIIDANEENESLKSDKLNGSQVNKSKAKIVKPVIKPPSKPTVNRSTINNKESDKQSVQNGTKNEIKQMNGKLNGKESVNKTNLEKNKNDVKLNGGTTIENQINGSNHLNDNGKSQWREKHEEFIKSIQTARKENGFEDDQQTHKHESIDRESTITTNSESTATTNSTTASNASTTTLNTTNERLNDDKGSIQMNESKPKQQRKIKPPQATRLIIKDNKTTKLNQINSNLNNANHKMPIGKKSINTACIECSICGRTFNRAAGERHIPFCEEKQRQRKNSSNVTNEEALARFRLRNAYRSNKGIKKRDKSVPNDKKEDRFVRQSSLRRALSTIDGLDQVFSKHSQTSNHNLVTSNLGSKRSTSHGSNLNKTTKFARDQSTNQKKQITTHSKSSSASSKGSAHNYSPISYRETAQSRVKARLNQQQKLQKQKMNSNYPPKTPVMKFKEKFPNHNNKLIEFGDSQQFSQVFKKHLNNSFEPNNNAPKTVPGVRTGGLSPTKEIYNKNNEDINDLEKLRARIKEMYLNSSNGSHSQNDFMNLDYLTGHNEYINENSFTRENSSSKMKSSKSVNDFITMDDSFNDAMISDIELPRQCHQCSTSYITVSARYCFNCGARRLGTVNSYLV